MKAAGNSALLLLLVMCVIFLSNPACAQNTVPKQDSSKSSSPEKTAGGAVSSGFSIESEMLTYTALKADGEVIACDVARYLNGVPAVKPDDLAENLCGDMIRGSSKVGVLILPFNSKFLSDFDIWRASMAAMRSFIDRASEEGCAVEAGATSDKAPGATLQSLLDLTLPGKALSLAQSVLASSETVSSVGGTIEDQTFMNGVARELRVLGISVMMPDTYLPLLARNSASANPYLFLQKLNEVQTIRRCLLLALDRAKADIEHTQASGRRLAPEKRKPESSPTPSSLAADDNAPTTAPPNSRAIVATVPSLLGEIDAFFLSLLGGVAGTATPSDQSKETVSPSGANVAQGKAAVLVPFAPSRLASLLATDLLAQELKIEANAVLPEASRWHVLRIRVLETGGSVIRNQNFLRSNTRYSGGAVGTYALFTLSGELECSGNLYAYGGPLRTDDFRKGSLRTNFYPALHGSCQALQDTTATPK